MKNKWLITLGAITSSIVAAPLVIAAGCNDQNKDANSKDNTGNTQPGKNEKQNNDNNAGGNTGNTQSGQNEDQKKGKNNQDSTDKQAVKLVKDDASLEGTLPKNVDVEKHKEVKYTSFVKNVKIFDVSKLTLELLKPIDEEQLSTPRDDKTKKQVIWQDYNKENEFRFKAPKGKKWFEGETFAKLLNIPDGYTITNAENPIYHPKPKDSNKKGSKKSHKKNGKKMVAKMDEKTTEILDSKASAYIDVTKDEKGWKATFRLFRKGTKDVAPAVSTEVYEVYFIAA